MHLLLKIVTVLIVFDAIVILFRPDFVKKYVNILSQGTKIYLAAIIKAILGLIFLFGAAECSHQWVIIIFGILALVGAVFIIALPQRARAIASWFGTKNTTTLRLLSIIYLLIGGLLVYSS